MKLWQSSTLSDWCFHSCEYSRHFSSFFFFAILFYIVSISRKSKIKVKPSVNPLLCFFPFSSSRSYTFFFLYKLQPNPFKCYSTRKKDNYSRWKRVRKSKHMRIWSERVYKRLSVWEKWKWECERRRSELRINERDRRIGEMWEPHWKKCEKISQVQIHALSDGFYLQGLIIFVVVVFFFFLLILSHSNRRILGLVLPLFSLLSLECCRFCRFTICWWMNPVMGANIFNSWPFLSSQRWK